MVQMVSEVFLLALTANTHYHIYFFFIHRAFSAVSRCMSSQARAPTKSSTSPPALHPCKYSCQVVANYTIEGLLTAPPSIAASEDGLHLVNPVITA